MTTGWRTDHRSWFPAAFRPPAFASRSSYSRRGVGPSSRSAYRTRQGVPDLDGVTAFRTHELRPGWAPSVPRGRRCSSRTGATSRPAPAASQRPVPAPRRTSHRQGSALNEASTRVQAFRPSGLPLACGRPDGTGRPWAFPRASHPADQEPDDARRGGDRPSSTDLELHAQLTSSISNPVVHSWCATSRRTWQGMRGRSSRASQSGRAARGPRMPGYGRSRQGTAFAGPPTTGKHDRVLAWARGLPRDHCDLDHRAIA